MEESLLPVNQSLAVEAEEEEEIEREGHVTRFRRSRMDSMSLVQAVLILLIVVVSLLFVLLCLLSLQNEDGGKLYASKSTGNKGETVYLRKTSHSTSVQRKYFLKYFLNRYYEI